MRRITPPARRSVRAMISRWDRDMARLIELGFPVMAGGAEDAHRNDCAAELIRNLGTAIGQAETFLAASDYGLCEMLRPRTPAPTHKSLSPNWVEYLEEEIWHLPIFSASHGAK